LQSYWFQLLAARILKPLPLPSDFSVCMHSNTGCLQLLEILEISWNLNGPAGNFCVMIENFILWLMALLHDDVALFVH